MNIGSTIDQRLTRNLEKPQDFYNAWMSWLKRREHFQERACQERAEEALFDNWLCCPTHRALLAERNQLHQWGRYYERRYGEDNFQNMTFLGNLWLQKFVYLAGLQA